MKKLLAILLILAMAVGMFAGCEADISLDDDGKANISIKDKEDDDEDEEENDEDDNDKDKDDEDDVDDRGDENDRDDQDAKQPETMVYDGSKVTISFAHTMGAKLQATLDYYIGEFNKLYPNITVEHEVYGNWDDIESRISSEIITDNAPNVAYCYPDHVATYNLSYSTVVLDSLIDSTAAIYNANGEEEIFGLTEEQKADFIMGFYGEGKVYGDGKMYTMPLSKSTEVLYYNKTFFEANGIDVPTTWEEMEAVCKQLKELDPKCIPLGYDSESNLFITLCEQYGYPYTTSNGKVKEHFLFNNDQCKAFAKEMRDWYQEGYITTQEIYGAYTSALFTETNKDMRHCYMSIGSSGAAFYYQAENGAFEVGIAPVPQVDPANPKALCQGPSLCILKDGNTSQQEIAASWLFVKFLTTNRDFQKEFSTVSGYMPVLKSVYEDPVYMQWLDGGNGTNSLNALAVRAGLEQQDAYFTPAVFYGSSAARTEVGKLLMHVMSDSDPDIDQLFQDAYDECIYMYG